jgi:electron transport complex protein RnfC
MTRTAEFAASLRLDPRKHDAMLAPLAVARPPARAFVALDQGSGGTAVPVVGRGDQVWRGTLLAVPDDPGAAALHAPISGRVAEITMHPLGTAGGMGPCLVIDGDGLDAPDPGLGGFGDYRRLEPGQLLERLRHSGIVGLGGAAFPAATKLAAARAGRVEHLVLNGAECEPWICCDDALMRERAPEVLLGARIICHVTGAARCTIAVEDDKPEALAALRAAAAQSTWPELEILSLPTLYPSGAETTLLTQVTGLEVPSEGLPSDVGLLCHNVGTAAAVARYIAAGEPLVSRVVTVTGSGVARPQNLEARIGTPISELVAACGGYAGEPRRLVAGGAMTGLALATDEVPLSKGMNCIVVATEADLALPAPELPCIRCGDCATVCPPGLLPQQLYRGVMAADRELLLQHGIIDCIECGCCDYVCPSRIRLKDRFGMARAEALRRRAEEAFARVSRQRYEEREQRMARLAAAEREAFERARGLARGESPPGDPD